ncbi:hypothetical protein P378_20630 [Desulforamulus profundi]|uniref:Uncharacterized protein n=1 Tax=Desulforamulus profundi TaxID=1383067 RepID=A0A2C6M3L6_9FIRM|nr:hypothetical protein P378_20630 [Desulforamulus profundi]
MLATAQTFNLKEYKALVLPAGVLIITLSILLWEHNIEFMVQIVQVLPPFLLALEAGLPLLLLVVAYLRGIGGVGK